MQLCMYVYTVYSIYNYIYIKKSGVTVLFLHSTLALIYTSYSATVNFKLLHKNFMRCTHQYCSFFFFSPQSPNPPKNSICPGCDFALIILLTGAALCLLMASPCSPKALNFSYRNPCYSRVLTAPSCARGVSSPLPPDVLFGCRQGAGAPALEQRSCGRAGGPALASFAPSTLCPLRLLLIHSLGSATRAGARGRLWSFAPHSLQLYLLSFFLPLPAQRALFFT